MADLAHGDYGLSAAPELGGAVTRLTWRGRDLLRPAPAGVSDILQTSSFALAPFANRIAQGAFTFEGRAVQLAPNFGDHPHALHGHGWQRAWSLDEAGPARLRMSYVYEPGDWPWPYHCTQELELDDSGAMFSLALHNRADTPMPASLGFHPYFLRTPGAELIANVSGVWRVDDTILPTHFDRRVDRPFAKGVFVDELPFIDNCYTGWDSNAVIVYEEHGVEILGSPEFAFFHLYFPVGETFFCAEPVSAMPDAVNHAAAPASGLRVLAPGETFSVSARIEAIAPQP